MGMLVEGKWTIATVATSDKKGAYDRLPRTFLDIISEDHPIFKPESGRYHLYVSLACPWATRTLIYRSLKGLEDHITVSVVSPDMMDQGWNFDEAYPGATKDDLFGFQFLKDVYTKADPNITTSVTVPVLWDKKTNTIVNNESSQIIRMFNSSFNELTGNELDFYPESKREEIDKINEKLKGKDAMKAQQETMGLYRKAGVNPMGGCLPMLFQFPILIAMFRFFPASIELRQESFLWADDLSSYDSIMPLPWDIPFYGDHVSLFTLLMTISTLIYTHMNSQMTSSQMPGMKWMMYLMPIMFLGFFNNYASSLSYYYFLANVFTFSQMYFMRRFVDDDALLAQLEENKKKPKKKSKFQKKLEEMQKKQEQQMKKRKKK